jgi:hypothetical protein
MDPTDHIVFLVAGITLGVLQGYNTWRQNRIKKTINEIHILTNGTMTQQKKILAEVTASKAYITKDPMDMKAAEDALKDYLSQSATSDTVDQKKP